MILTTDQQFAEAMRHSRRVSVYSIDDGGLVLEARGIIISFDKGTISILDEVCGVFNFIRENIEVRLVPKARRL